MRICVVGPTYPFRGGIAHYTTLLVRHLREAGHKAPLLSFTRQYPRWLFPGKADRDPSDTPLRVDCEYILDSTLVAALRHTGFEVSAVATGREGLAAVPEVQPDLVVLDVMLPDLDGFEVCRRLRTEGIATPVVFLTARDATEDKVRGLSLGGDDYLVKPFSLEELVARIDAVLRRAGIARNSSRMSFGPVELDDEAHRVTRAGVEVPLTPTEYNLLHYLLLNKNKALTRAQILDRVWKYDFGGDGGVVETYIGYLRRKLGDGDPRLIHTIRGVGYAIRDPG